jgi:RNA polymerase sigma-70 factor (ECF subfamily)
MTRNAHESLTQDELIREICRGQTELFYQLIRPFERTVFSVAYSVLNDVAEAEDVTQEAFLKALKGLPGFRGESKFRTWLIQITLNEARLRLRRRRAHLHESLDESSGSEDGGDYIPRDLADWREIPSEALARKELGKRIEQTLLSLKPIYREVLILRDMERFNTEETSQILGISKDLVKTRLLRARLQMREALAPGYDGNWTAEMMGNRRVRPW